MTFSVNDRVAVSGLCEIKDYRGQKGTVSKVQGGKFGIEVTFDIPEPYDFNYFDEDELVLIEPISSYTPTEIGDKEDDV